jgi:plasmid stabilization system protein ParE
MRSSPGFWARLARDGILDEAEADLERAFNYYQLQREGLGVELVDEFRRALELILRHPTAWQSLDDTYRRCRLHRFPYGIFYRVDAASAQLVIVAIMHLAERPDAWRSRDLRRS